jgi:hypothetical protein
MTELHTTLTAVVATAPLAPAPGEAQWNQFYGLHDVTANVGSSVLNNPDDAQGTSSVSEQGTQIGTSVISNPLPYWWPDLTNMTPGSFHSTPYTGAPQPVTN